MIGRFVTIIGRELALGFTFPGLLTSGFFGSGFLGELPVFLGRGITHPPFHEASDKQNLQFLKTYDS